MTIGEVAAPAALGAILTLVVSGITIALFFGGAGTFWGPVNDLFVAATLLLLVPVVIATWRLAPDDIGPWFGLITLATVAGLVVVAVGQVLLVVGVINLQASFLIGGIGIMPLVAWAIGLVVLILTRDMMSVTVGWLLAAAIVAAGLGTLVALVGPVWLTAAGSVLVLVLLVAWLAALSGEVRVAV